jgi:hypothetical protein
MLWSLISSAYVIYLYRKLKAEQEPAASETERTGGGSGTDAEIDKLNAQIRALEARLTNPKGQETAP